MALALAPLFFGLNAEIAQQIEEQRRQAFAVCNEAAFLNLDGTEPDDLGVKMNDCRNRANAACADWATNALSLTEAGPLIDGVYMDCTQFSGGA